MDSQEHQTTVVVRRRRRTARHRRNRSLRRAVLLAAVVGMLLGFWVSLIPEDFGSYLASFLPADRSTTIGKRAQLTIPPPMLDPPRSQRDVYPYSLVPGGVRNARELRDVFEHDPVLASHYRDFDFRRARIIRLAEDKTVYVSYRIAGKIYWTTRRVPLHAGEVLITDGVITIRTRCGNQVSLSPRQEVSPQQEPNVAVLDRPMLFFDPVGAVGPAPNVFESSLQRPGFPLFAPAAPNFATVSGPGFGFIFPPNPGVCGQVPPKRKPVYGGPSPGGATTKHKKKGSPCSPGGGGSPGVAPEPASLVLLSTGLAAIYSRRRSLRARFANPPLLAQ
jgi:PEP-CTERM motif-containing protein